ncbi:MAG: putative membrane protein [Chitinophagales bacterium]|jgi:putative membrane protein
MAVKLEEKSAKQIILALSVVVALLVGVLNWGIDKRMVTGLDLSFFPKFHAFLNSIVALLLVLGLVFIKKGKQELHKKTMFTSFVVSAVFLMSYVLYHTLADPTAYGGGGALKGIYYFILITHIVLAAVMMPFILMTFYYAWSGKLEKHKSLAKKVWPFWFYVAITGVVIYFMIAPYYTH